MLIRRNDALKGKDSLAIWYLEVRDLASSKLRSKYDVSGKQKKARQKAHKAVEENSGTYAVILDVTHNFVEQINSKGQSL